MIDPCAVYSQKMSEINNIIEGKIGMAASAYSSLTGQTSVAADFATTLNSVQETGSSNGLSEYFLGTIYDKDVSGISGVNSSNSTSLANNYTNYGYTGLGGKLDAGALESAIQSKACTYQIDANLIKAVIKAESNFNASAVSGAGAIGLMQLMPATAKALGVENPYDALQNMDGGIRYLKTQIENFGGNVKLGLAAYNCGPSRVKKLNITNIDDPQQFAKLPKETQNYIKKIMSYLTN